MLHLQPRIHLQEVEVLHPRLFETSHEKLHRPRVHIPRRERQPNRRLPHPPSQVLTHNCGRGLLNHLLVPPLHRALPLPQIQTPAMLIRHQLNLDMPGPLDQLLQIDLARPKAPLRLATGRHISCRQILRPGHSAHTLPTAARGCLQHHGIPNRAGHANSLIHISQPRHRSRHPRHTRRIRRLSRPRLRSQHPHHTRWRTDKSHPGSLTSLSKVRILRQEPIPRMHRIRPHSPGNRQNHIPPQIALRRRRRPQPISLIRMQHMQRRAVRVGVHGHRRQSHLPACTNHAQCNLTAIRNQDFFYRPSQAAILTQPSPKFACRRPYHKQARPPTSGRPSLSFKKPPATGAIRRQWSSLPSSVHFPYERPSPS